MRSILQKGKSNKILKVRVLTGALSFYLEGATNEIPLHTEYSSMYGQLYECNHPAYNHCTLYLIGDKGLAVIQQRYDKKSKCTWWSEIDRCLTDALYLHSKFKSVFDKYASTPTNGLYPTMTVRQLMWNLRMKPMVRERWETYFDKTGF